MLPFTRLFGQPLVECLGWSLVHFLWQGLVLGNAMLLLLLLLRRRQANVRYVAACGTLLTMAVCPLVTFVWLWDHLDARHGTAGTAVKARRTSPNDPPPSLRQRIPRTLPNPPTSQNQHTGPMHSSRERDQGKDCRDRHRIPRSP